VTGANGVLGLLGGSSGFGCGDSCKGKCKLAYEAASMYGWVQVTGVCKGSNRGAGRRL
jgi:hypothetical protein